MCDMRLKRGKNLLRTLAFLLVFAVCFFIVQSAFGIDQLGAYLHSRGILKEKAGSLDGVYIGASNVHAYWQPLIGWNEYGIAVYNYSFDAMPAGAVRALMAAVRSRQPDALFIVNINQFRNREDSEVPDVVDKLHRCSDYMPASIERVRAVFDMARDFKLTLQEQIELLFPIITFHSRWNDLKGWALGAKTTDYKSSRSSNDFLKGWKDVSRRYTINEKRMPEEEAVLTGLYELLDYIEKSGARVLFVKVPQAMRDDRQEYMNTLEDVILERGYPCLDLLAEVESTGIDPKWDFYNGNHTNVHGSIKYTRRLAEYMIENYGFTDKRGVRGWESWDETGKKYDAVLRKSLLPFEREGAKRAAIEAPALAPAVVEDRDITLSWSASEGAGGYQIYRKSAENGNRWLLAGETDNETFTWRDSGRKPSTEYTYTVVPCRRDGDGWLYGSFDVRGVSATTAAKKTAKAEPAEPDGDEASEEDGE